MIAEVMRVHLRRHTFQVLTKRSGRLGIDARRPQSTLGSPTSGGVSVENRKHGLPRIDHLRDAQPLCVFFQSSLLEDLGSINLEGFRGSSWA